MRACLPTNPHIYRTNQIEQSWFYSYHGLNLGQSRKLYQLNIKKYLKSEPTQSCTQCCYGKCTYFYIKQFQYALSLLLVFFFFSPVTNCGKTYLVTCRIKSSKEKDSLSISTIFFFTYFNMNSEFLPRSMLIS